MIDLDKNEIRSSLLTQRGKLSKSEVESMSRKIVSSVQSHAEWKNAAEVLLYWPIKNEVDVTPLFRDALESGKKVYMPCCRRDEPGIMDFGVVRAEEDLLQGSFGIKEPCRSKCEFPDAISPDVMIIPGVGFDRKGYRIGFGGGYYDRFLAHPQKAGSLAVGVCYYFQLVDNIAVEEWDKPVQLICTDKDVIWPK
ncbi:5-formyltetrahydrofolate cyclo-ligase [Desulfovibrio gilichinskyi]|uniref:5-formyltetrahydrofolate cyclo-ligase n=1 Tax=Desulfovibrio gilichinskyi TaxID=1519643 RepID=A0A1X7EF53_9BACT|nr:5-formyltetrahydrofolate cyclo-ligase [Desulfovibrio gilichinskyi]SMF32863.1 5-formyltetrahydrofolate cyclo-ligase [Desulfovibrio gilichinskyi]